MAAIDDAAVRERALEPLQSFIVQAPAGSGKTSLLTQRVLRLLTTVEEPEQVVAVTFTRKAAEEMRTRIVDALAAAAGEPPQDEFLLGSWRLAVAARDHDRQRGWDLTEQPSRLRILTIDALCQSLVRQMPITARMAGLPTIEEDAGLLYSEAAREALGGLVEGGATRQSIATVLRHLDNDWSKLEGLIADMLARRDQWLPMAAGSVDKAAFEQAYARIVETELGALDAALPQHCRAELTALAAYAGSHLEHSPLVELTALPAPTHAHLATWQALASLLLTAAGSWRQRIDKRQGFPPKGSGAADMKQRWQDVIAELGTIVGLRANLARIAGLPLAAYDGDDWDVVSALLTLLQRAAAHFDVHCEHSGRTDFTAFAIAALNALGPTEEPTDLALALDYQLRHVLIDEFQDTSITQLELLRRLTAGWQRDDGRTLFLVGDPMQSIYRFRQAEVSLFQRLLDDGRIGNVELEALALVVNFRAHAGLVDWINALTPRALALIEAENSHFVAQHAVKPASREAWQLHGFEAHDGAAEAAAVCATIAELRGRDADASIAVLVRSRNHLGDIRGALAAAEIPFVARDIKPFATVPVVADLYALARALLHAADRVAWLALLRAPWCGLLLADLAVLARIDSTLADAMTRPAVTAELSSDGRARVARVSAIMATAARRGRELGFARLLEDTWIALGGPAVTTDTASLADARAFLDLIESLENEDALLSAERIAARLANRYASAVTHDPLAVQLMTMHRAKGLEFDYVLIPGLGRKTRAEQKRLLLWREDVDRLGHPRLLIAPIAMRRESGLYAYLQARDAADAAAETVRVLYVALTRARLQVHLFGHAQTNSSGVPQPHKGSLLELLWPAVGEYFAAACTPLAQSARGAPPERAVTLRRALPETLPAMATTDEVSRSDEIPVEFDWVGITARHIGTVTHRLLQDFAEHGGISEGAEADARRARFARGQLRSLGVAEADLEAAVTSVVQAFATTMASPRGRWLFDDAHRDSAAELSLGVVARVVIDRTFIDADGQRWIIDFKTGSHSGSGLEDWLDNERERYRGQLEHYGRVMALLDARPIRLGLYFPLVDGWREWPCPAA
ncbi:MAG: UvrD-helicase domain-containing protein [Gammaproteobacteria bacterium]